MNQVGFSGSTQLDPQLGGLLSEHGPARGARIVFIVFGVLSLAGAVLGFVQESVLGGVIGLGLAALFIGVERLLSKVRVRVFEHGIERRGPLGTKRIAWHVLRSYQLQIIDTTAVAAGSAGGVIGALLARAIVKAIKKDSALTPNTVALHAQDGTKIVLSANATGYKELLETLVPALSERIFPAARHAFESGSEVSFGKKLKLQRGVGVTFVGLFGKKHVLPLEQAASAVLEHTVLVIRRSDTNAVWQSVPAIHIENLGVLQKFVEMNGRRYDDRLPMAWTS